MALRTPPTFLQAGTHPAENTRLSLQSLLGGATGTFTGGVSASDPAHGVVNVADLKVTQNGTPNLSVNVAAGGAFVRGTQSANQGVYHAWNDAAANLPLASANATNPRRDLVVVQVRDSTYSGADNDARLVVVTGTPAASPADPTVPANSVVLARVTVNAGATSVTNVNIADLRPRASGLGVPQGAWVPYSPAWTEAVGQPNVGNGSKTGRWMRIGTTVHFSIKIVAGSTTTFGSGSSGSGLPGFRFGLPVSAAAGADSALVVGIATVPGTAEFGGIGRITSGSNLVEILYGATLFATSGTLSRWWQQGPGFWGTGTQFLISGTYEASPV